jgi:type IV fimbrial biogenesis protein FimU
MSNEPDRETVGSHPAGGFTLVELMVVVVLVAVFAGLAVPSLSSTLQRADARQTARELANAFRRARNQAMSRGEVVAAEVVTTEGTSQAGSASSDLGHIELLRSNNNVGTCSTVSGYTPVGDPVRVRDHSNNLEIVGMTGGDTDRVICFTPDGRALDGTGSVVEADADGCELENFRMWIAEKDVSANSSTELQNAVPCDGNSIARTKIQFWSIEVPYNGAIKANR